MITLNLFASLDQLQDEAAEKEWKKREGQWRKEHNSRMALLQEVFTQRHREIQIGNARTFILVVKLMIAFWQVYEDRAKQVELKKEQQFNRMNNVGRDMAAMQEEVRRYFCRVHVATCKIIKYYIYKSESGRNI